MNPENSPLSSETELLLKEAADSTKAYLRPSEIMAKLEDIQKQCIQNGPLKANFEEITVRGQTYRAFVLENESIESDKSLLGTDGVHTTEFHGGSAFVAYAGLLAAESGQRVWQESKLRRVAYVHLNPAPMECTSRQFLQNPSMNNFLAHTTRAKEHIDWGYPQDEDGRAFFAGTEAAMELFKLLKTTRVIPLHNSGADNAKVYVNRGFPEDIAMQLSSRLTNNSFLHGNPETAVMDIARKIAPGVYDISQHTPRLDGQRYTDSTNYLPKLFPDALGVTVETPYFEPINRVITQQDQATFQVLANKTEDLLDTWIERWQEQDFRDLRIEQLQASVCHYYARYRELLAPKKAVEEARSLSDKKAQSEAIIAGIFYPLLIQNHARRAAEIAQARVRNVESMAFRKYIEQSNQLRADAVEMFEKYTRRVSMSRQMRTQIGCMATLAAN